MYSKMVSIIVPVYNTEIELLKRCINSLLDQTYKNIEIIVVDDGSKDEIKKIYIEELNLDKIKLFHKENGGVSSARNMGIRYSSGEYLTFVDSDDWVENDFVSRLLYNMISTNADISICNISYDKETCSKELITENTVLEIPGNQIFKMLLEDERVGGYLCNKLLKKELIKNYLNEHVHYCEDFVFIAQYCFNVRKAVFDSKKNYHYFLNDNNATSNFSYNDRIFSLIQAYLFIEEIYIKNSPNEVIKVQENLLKIALNLKARYKISKVENVEQLKCINDIIKKYFKVIVKSKIRIVDKINILFTMLMPKTMFRLKQLILRR